MRRAALQEREREREKSSRVMARLARRVATRSTSKSTRVGRISQLSSETRGRGSVGGKGTDRGSTLRREAFGMLHVCRKQLDAVNIVLASKSPRRQELMGALGLTFETFVSSFEEDLNKESYANAADYAADTAFLKVEDVASSISQDPGRKGGSYLIIGADTVVDLNGEVMEKPKDEDHAFEMLRKLSGNTHKVHTGIAVCTLTLNDQGEEAYSETSKCSETTSVTFSDLPDEVIRAYIGSGEPMDKAGAYGIQGSGGSMVSGIAGCYFNVSCCLEVCFCFLFFPPPSLSLSLSTCFFHWPHFSDTSQIYYH